MVKIISYRSNSKVIFYILTLVLVFFKSSAQVELPINHSKTYTTNNISTAVSFLLITPDSKAGAMGDAGAAVQPDANSISSNPSKLAFLDDSWGMALSYSPWLKNLVDDVNLIYLSGFHRFDDLNTIGAALRYFSLGEIPLTDFNQQDLGTYSPHEFSVDVTFARKLGNKFSLGTTTRYIQSNTVLEKFFSGVQNGAASAFAMDVSAYYKQPTYFFEKKTNLSVGMNISNIGTNLNFAGDGNARYLPANMKIGAASTILLDDDNQVVFALDFNKLLLPTQPNYNVNGNIIDGKDPNRSMLSSLFGSFSDAPGGFREELKEVTVAVGMDYTYNQKFALRAGYCYENPQKGNRRYFTIGTGLTFNSFAIDLAYLIAETQKSPLANTLRFTLLFNFGASSKDIYKSELSEVITSGRR